MRIEILCTGDEILTGKTINTNYSHIAQRLEDVGLSAYWGTTVGDDRDSLLAAFRQAAERAQAVPIGLSMNSAPAGSMACLRLFGGITRLRRA
jgi:molybdopterin-biosynthesis enzyme MoeA-like protein